MPFLYFPPSESSNTHPNPPSYPPYLKASTTCGILPRARVLIPKTTVPADRTAKCCQKVGGLG